MFDDNKSAFDCLPRVEDFIFMSSDPKDVKNHTRIVRCPQCGKDSEYSPHNAFRPFCSERCRLIDLGEWADGSYKVPTEPHEMTAEELDLLEKELEKADRLREES